MSNKEEIPWLTEKMRADKERRALQKMKIKKDGVEETVKEKFPIVTKIMSHPAVKGCVTANDVLIQLSKLYDENQKLREGNKARKYNGLFAELAYEFQYTAEFSKSARKSIPSQKNQYGLSKGKMHVSTDVKNFRADFHHQWLMQNNHEEPMLNHVIIDMLIYMPQKNETDEDGKVTAILDAMVKAKIIKKDGYLNIIYNPNSVYRQGRAGCDIKIYQLTEEEFLKQKGIL